MKKLVLAALAAAAVAVPAAPAVAAQCTNLVSVVGANSVGYCSERVWERNRIWYYCTLDTDFDGQADAACEPLFVIEWYG